MYEKMFAHVSLFSQGYLNIMQYWLVKNTGRQLISKIQVGVAKDKIELISCPVIRERSTFGGWLQEKHLYIFRLHKKLQESYLSQFEILVFQNYHIFFQFLQFGLCGHFL